MNIQIQYGCIRFARACTVSHISRSVLCIGEEGEKLNLCICDWIMEPTKQIYEVAVGDSLVKNVINVIKDLMSDSWLFTFASLKMLLY